MEDEIKNKLFEIIDNLENGCSDFSLVREQANKLKNILQE